jgi:hypothetical protein
MKGEFFGAFRTGTISYLSKSLEADELVSYDTAFDGADNDGWQPVLEDNGVPRAVKTDRVVEGYISSERLDTQNDIVPLSAFVVEKDNEEDMPLIEYIAKRAPLVYQHANTEEGVVILGQVVAYKIVKDKPKFRWAIYKGSDLVDKCWKEMLKYGTNGGFSIGGAKIEPECDAQKCVLNKLDVVEVSWTPNPANVDAKATMVRLVKSTKAQAEETPPEDEAVAPDEDDETLEKPCPWRKRASAIEASDIEDGLKRELLEVIKQREPQSNAAVWKLPYDRQERELDAIKPLEMDDEKEDEEEDDDNAEKSADNPGDEQSPSDPTAPTGGVSTTKKEDEEENKEPPKDDEDDDVEKSEMLKAITGLTAAVTTLTERLDKQEDDEESEEEDSGDDDENGEEKAKKALDVLKDEGYDIGKLVKGGPERPAAGTTAPLAKAANPENQRVYDAVGKYREKLQKYGGAN